MRGASQWSRGVRDGTRYPGTRPAPGPAELLGDCQDTVLSPWHAPLRTTNGSLKSENSVKHILLEMFRRAKYLKGIQRERDRIINQSHPAILCWIKLSFYDRVYGTPG